MGRTRKGKKLSAAASNEDHGSGGEEVIPVSKKRGRLLKALKDDIDEEEIEKIEEGKGENTKRVKPSEAQIGQKRRLSRAEENLISVKEENGVSSEDVKINGLGQNENVRTKSGEGETRRKGRFVRDKENGDSVKEENGLVAEDVKTKGFRPNGRRRKSKPHRAAEAGVDCKRAVWFLSDIQAPNLNSIEDEWIWNNEASRFAVKKCYSILEQKRSIREQTGKKAALQTSVYRRPRSSYGAGWVLTTVWMGVRWIC